MLDHILGKPSANVRRWQAVLTALVTLLLARRKRAPWGLRWIEKLDGRVPIWKAVVGWWTFLYLIRHMDDILGLHAPEPLREYYNRSFYRATWIFTALDAGFWTAMSIRPKWLRDIMSLVFSIYYLVCGNRAAEKVRKVRALVTIEHLRVSWNKGVENPLLRMVRQLHMPTLGVHKVVELGASGKTMKAACHVFYAGSAGEMRECSRLIVDIPGGGFVAMGPASHEEYLADWALKTQAVVLSVDYAKAPEYPYPYAIDQCYEVYRELVQTQGRCIGMNQRGHSLHKVLVGDSAGGNLAACLQFRILESREQLPRPDGLLFIYGCFNVDVRAWMTRQETHCLLGESATKPRDHLHHESPLAVSSKEPGRGAFRRPLRLDERVRVVSGQQPDKYYVPLTMTSSFTYFNDQVLSPEMMRAMVIMYVGPNARPDFKSDYYLSPRVAPDHLLEQFPPTYFICGEKDPMVDDTVLFAARIRKAQAAKQGAKPMEFSLEQSSSQQNLDTHQYCEYSKSSLYRRRHSQPRLRPAGSSKFFIGSTDVSEDEDSAKPSLLPQSLRMTSFARASDSPASVIKLKLVAGMSHGFLQMFSLLPESRQVNQMLARWLDELLVGGSREISPYSRCASHVDSPFKAAADHGRSNRSSRASSVKSEEEACRGDSLAMDFLLRRNRNGNNKSIRDHHGVEIVSAASMVYRRGSGLADPLS